NWRALLTKLATARAIDRLRRRYRWRPFNQPADLTAAPDPAPPPEQQVENAELLSKLRESLPTLPPQPAQAFVLHCVEGWTYQEIADHLSVSTGAVGMLLLRARAKLKELLGDGVESGRR
ncbi:MAG TPA: RNA polymerase sigma factor, partial [Tepidisphaeraceae bacterium]|nr:RNA polymerase sigma factor [Tepidisphaeraceae bacterium]